MENMNRKRTEKSLSPHNAHQKLKKSNRKPGSTIFTLKDVEKMQLKITKVLQAYDNISSLLKQKEERIKQLEEENKTLKKLSCSQNQARQISDDISSIYDFQRILEPKRTIANQRLAGSRQSQCRESDSKWKRVELSPKYHSKYNFSMENTRRQNLELEAQSTFEQGKKVSEIAKKNYQAGNQEQMLSISPVKSKLFDRSAQTDPKAEARLEDQSFVGVLEKLKAKMQNYENQAEATDSASKLNKVKSLNCLDSKAQSRMDMILNEDCFRAPSKNIPTISKEREMSALKAIWKQRDLEIKKMDELFGDLDSKLNIAQRG